MDKFTCVVISYNKGKPFAGVRVLCNRFLSSLRFWVLVERFSLFADRNKSLAPVGRKDSWRELFLSKTWVLHDWVSPSGAHHHRFSPSPLAQTKADQLLQPTIPQWNIMTTFLTSKLQLSGSNRKLHVLSWRSFTPPTATLPLQLLHCGLREYCAISQASWGNAQLCILRKAWEVAVSLRAASPHSQSLFLTCKLGF